MGSTPYSQDHVLGASPTVRGGRDEEPWTAWVQFKGQPVVTSSYLFQHHLKCHLIAASGYFSCQSLRLEYSAPCSHKWFLTQVSGQIAPFRSLHWQWAQSSPYSLSTSLLFSFLPIPYQGFLVYGLKGPACQLRETKALSALSAPILSPVPGTHQ